MKTTNMMRGNELIVYHSDDMCCVARFVGSFGTIGEYTFVPSRSYGLVAMTDYRSTFGQSEPMYGWLVFRPSGLQFTISSDSRLELVACSRESLEMWYKRFSPWGHVGRYGGNAW